MDCVKPHNSRTNKNFDLGLICDTLKEKRANSGEYVAYPNQNVLT